MSMKTYVWPCRRRVTLCGVDVTDLAVVARWLLRVAHGRCLYRLPPATAYAQWLRCARLDAFLQADSAGLWMQAAWRQAPRCT